MTAFGTTSTIKKAFCSFQDAIHTVVSTMILCYDHINIKNMCQSTLIIFDILQVHLIGIFAPVIMTWRAMFIVLMQMLMHKFVMVIPFLTFMLVFMHLEFFHVPTMMLC